MKKFLKVFGLSFLLFIIVGISLRGYVLKPTVWLESIAGKQTFGMAVHLSKHPLKKDHYLVTDKAGIISLFKEGSQENQTVLDYREKVKSDTGEEGMLSAIIDPKNPKDLYVYYCLNIDDPLTNRLVRFKLDSEDKAITDTEEILVEFNRPFTGHNGGYMEFGKDGYLYLGLGEGSYAFKKMGDQLDSKILGSIIRIDVHTKENGKAYGIPKDNPFIGDKVIPAEVWAYGLRNPWRWSFLDENTIILGDVGHNTHEEINIVKKGDNLGWPYMEGPICSEWYPKCNKEKYKAPMTYFSRDVSRSVTGGIVYRGSKVDELKGQYVFADYLRGINTLDMKNTPKFVETILTKGFKIVFPKIPMNFGPTKGDTIHPVSFLEDDNKEILVVALNGGIFRIVPISLWTGLKAYFYMIGNFR